VSQVEQFKTCEVLEKVLTAQGSHAWPTLLGTGPSGQAAY
jgi:hypothetical protein